MRQSDVGIAYEEESSDDEDMDDDDVTGDEADDVTEENGENDVTGDMDDEDFEMDETVKDPRAGKVDVVLPQLQPGKLMFKVFLGGRHNGQFYIELRKIIFTDPKFVIVLTKNKTILEKWLFPSMISRVLTVMTQLVYFLKLKLFILLSSYEINRFRF